MARAGGVTHVPAQKCYPGAGLHSSGPMLSGVRRSLDQYTNSKKKRSCQTGHPRPANERVCTSRSPRPFETPRHLGH